MDMKQIRAIVAVADAGSFSGAALVLSYSVSAVSKQVASVEAELGVRLFERKANAKVSKTRECEELLHYFRKLQDDYEDMRRYVGMHYKSAECVLTIGTTIHLGATGLEPYLEGFVAKYPGVKINWVFDTDENLLSGVINRRVDFSITGTIESKLFPQMNGCRLDFLLDAAKLPRKEFVFTPFYKGKLMMALRADHPAIREGIVRLADLRGERFIFTDTASESGPRKHSDFLSVCRSEGFEPRVTEMNIANRDMLMGMVRSGNYAAPLMQRPSATYNGVTVCPLDKEYYTVTNLIFSRKDNGSPVLRDFIRFIDERWKCSEEAEGAAPV